MLSLSSYCPALVIGLIFSCYCKRTGRHVVGYCRACGGKRTFAYCYGCYKISVATDKRIVGNFASVLTASVIVYRDNSAAEVYPRPDVAVAYISEVGGVGFVTYR